MSVRSMRYTFENALATIHNTSSFDLDRFKCDHHRCPSDFVRENCLRKIRSFYVNHLPSAGPSFSESFRLTRSSSESFLVILFLLKFHFSRSSDSIFFLSISIFIIIITTIAIIIRFSKSISLEKLSVFLSF